MSVLQLQNLYKSFGSLVVTNEVTLDIAAGERHAIIGPNGAGKTSLIHQIGGQLKPTRGRILFKGFEITGLAPERIARLGLARTFQKNSLFRNLTVLENVAMAVHLRRGNPLGSLRRRGMMNLQELPEVQKP